MVNESWESASSYEKQTADTWRDTTLAKFNICSCCCSSYYYSCYYCKSAVIYFSFFLKACERGDRVNTKQIGPIPLVCMSNH